MNMIVGEELSCLYQIVTGTQKDRQADRYKRDNTMPVRNLLIRRLSERQKVMNMKVWKKPI